MLLEHVVFKTFVQRHTREFCPVFLQIPGMVGKRTLSYDSDCHYVQAFLAVSCMAAWGNEVDLCDIH